MRKIICLLCVLVLCMSLACPVFAAQNTFVPSITYKDTPDIDDAQQNGENTGSCLVTSSIDDARAAGDKATEDQQELLDLYAKLDNGTMKLPLEGNFVIRDLISVTFDQVGCIDPSHGHEEWLAQPGNCIDLTFDLGVSRGTDVQVLVYKDGQWTPAEDVVNNGNGTVTCTLEDLGTIAFCVENAKDIPKTGDNGVILWVAVMAVCAAAAVSVLALRRKDRD